MVETIDGTADLLTNATPAPAADGPLGFGSLAGDLYARWTLDCVVDIAYHVSKDFVARPEFYKNDVTDKIVDLRMEWGTITNFPNTTQRAEMVNPIFGPPDGMAGSVDNFRRWREPLLKAVTILSERSIADPTAGIQQTILSALALLTAYLRNFDGTSLRTSQKQIANESELAYSVLRSPGVAQVFGVTAEISKDWPLTSDDANGALLIRSIGEKLQLGPYLMFTDEKFQRLRRVAETGNQAIKTILDPDSALDKGLPALIVSVYAWAVAIHDYLGDNRMSY
jgi:hypothetical protein